MRDAAKQREYRRKCYLTLDRKRRKTWFEENGPCKKCGSWIDLELDHINPEEKETSSVWSWSDLRREKELEKCQALCSICHKAKTALELYIKFFREWKHGTNHCYQNHKCRCILCKQFYKNYRHEKYIRTGN